MTVLPTPSPSPESCPTTSKFWLIKVNSSQVPQDRWLNVPSKGHEGDPFFSPNLGRVIWILVQSDNIHPFSTPSSLLTFNHLVYVLWISTVLSKQQQTLLNPGAYKKFELYNQYLEMFLQSMYYALNALSCCPDRLVNMMLSRCSPNKHMQTNTNTSTFVWQVQSTTVLPP